MCRISFFVFLSLLPFTVYATEETPSIFTENNCFGTTIPIQKPPKFADPPILWGDIQIPPGIVDIPPALRTVNVCSEEALRQAISDAQPGDHIILCERDWRSFDIERSGTPQNPIVIQAEKVATDGGQVRFPRALTGNRSAIDVLGSNIIFDGLLMDNARVAYRMVGAKNITVTRGVMLEPDPFFTSESGYGVATFDADGVKIIGNVFRGFFNHNLSMKERVPTMFIIGNIFDGCGFECINLGQQPDGFRGVKDMTSGVAVVKDNHFTGRKTQTGLGMNGIRVVNVKEAYIEGNTFEGVWRAQINVSYGSIGSEHVKPTDVLQPSGPRTLDALIIKSNNFGSGGKIELFGRGEANDVIDVLDNSGSPNCVIGGFSTQGGVGGYLGQIYDGPPIVRQSDNSFSCK